MDSEPKKPQGTSIVQALPINVLISNNSDRILEKLDEKKPHEKLPKSHIKDNSIVKNYFFFGKNNIKYGH